MGKFPDHRLDLGALVLEREIAVTGGMGPAEAGDFAAHPDMAEIVLHRPLQGGREFRNGEFGRVGEVRRGSHFPDRFGRLRFPPKVGTFAQARQPKPLADPYTLRYRVLYMGAYRRKSC